MNGDYLPMPYSPYGMSGVGMMPAAIDSLREQDPKAAARLLARLGKIQANLEAFRQAGATVQATAPAAAQALAVAVQANGGRRTSCTVRAEAVFPHTALTLFPEKVRVEVTITVG